MEHIRDGHAEEEVLQLRYSAMASVEMDSSDHQNNAMMEIKLTVTDAQRFAYSN